MASLAASPARRGFLAEARDRGGLGARLVAAGLVGVGLGISALPFYTLGLFLKPVTAEFGWGRATFQSGFLALMAGMLATGWLWGLGVDRFGARRVGIGSQVGLALGFVAIAFVGPQPALWLAAFALLGVLGGGTSPVTWTRGVAAAFSTGRGTALGLTLMGSGLAAFAAPLALSPVIAVHGWRAGYFALAAAVLLVALPVAWAFYREPRAVAHAAGVPAAALPGLDAPAALRSWRFWVMAAVFAAVSFGVGGLIPNLVPLLTDRGMAAADAALYAALAGIAVVVGRVVAGVLVDRFWAPAVGAAFLALPALSCLLLIGDTLPHGVATGLAAALIGLAAGAEFDLVAFLIARYFGMRRYGTLYAVQSVFLMGAAGVAPLLFGRIFDATGSYDGALAVSAALFAFAPLLLLTLGRYPKHD